MVVGEAVWGKERGAMDRRCPSVQFGPERKETEGRWKETCERQRGSWSLSLEEWEWAKEKERDGDKEDRRATWA